MVDIRYLRCNGTVMMNGDGYGPDAKYTHAGNRRRILLLD